MKRVVCKVVCVIMSVICLFTIYLCVKVITEIPVFVDLRSVSLVIYGGVGLVTAMIAFVTGKIGWKNN